MRQVHNKPSQSQRMSLDKTNKVNIFSYALKLQLQEENLKSHNLRTRIILSLNKKLKKKGVSKAFSSKMKSVLRKKQSKNIKSNLKNGKKKAKKFKLRKSFNKIIQLKIFFKINRFLKKKGQGLKKTKITAGRIKKFLNHLRSNRKLFRNKPYKYKDKERPIKVKFNQRINNLNTYLITRKNMKYNFKSEILKWKKTKKKFNKNEWLHLTTLRKFNKNQTSKFTKTLKMKRNKLITQIKLNNLLLIQQHTRLWLYLSNNKLKANKRQKKIYKKNLKQFLRANIKSKIIKQKKRFYKKKNQRFNKQKRINKNNFFKRIKKSLNNNFLFLFSQQTPIFYNIFIFLYYTTQKKNNIKSS